jgi:hypothetical protein
VSPREALKIFETLFADSFANAPESIRDRQYFVLEENDPAAKLKRVEIRDVPEGSLLLKMQEYPALSGVFKSTKGECKRCDYIILTPCENDLYILYIEMKSLYPNKQDVILQLKGADCFMTYCRALAECFHSSEISSCSSKKRFILFYSNNSNKTSIVPRAMSAVHSSPENMMRFPVGSRKKSGPFVMFKELL